MNQVLVIKESHADLTRYYYSNFRLTTKKDSFSWAGYTELPGTDKLVWKFGRQGADVLIELHHQKGVHRLKLSSYQLTVTRHWAFKWKDLEPEILADIKRNFGSFRVRRDNIVTRMLYVIARNVMEPLFPKLYRG